MGIKVKLKPDLKATIRFKDKRELDFFRFIMLRIRDDPSKNHPEISVKDPDGREAPKLPEMKPPIQAQPIQPATTEAPVLVQAKPVEIQVKPEIKCYTKADLTVEGKIQCPNCIYNDEIKSTCQRGQPSMNYYHDFNGNIMGCPEGVRRETP